MRCSCCWGFPREVVQAAQSQIEVWEVQRKHKARDARVPLRVPWPLGEGPMWRSGEVVPLPWARGSGLQLPSTSHGLLALASRRGLFPPPRTLLTPWPLPRTCPGVTRCATVPDAQQGGRAAGAELLHGSGSSARSDGGVSGQGGLGHGRGTRGQHLPRVRCHLAEEGLGYKARE